MRITQHDTREKLIYFLETYLSLYDCLQSDVRSREGMSLHELTDAMGFFFDWEVVIRHVGPHLLVVMSGGRRDEKRTPAYIIIPGEGDWIEMTRNNAARLVEVLARDTTRDGVDETLSSIRGMVTQLPQDRVGEAMKHLRGLNRIMKPNL